MAAAPPQPAGQPAAPVPDEGLPDVTPMVTILAAALIPLLALWAGIRGRQKRALVQQTEQLLQSGDMPTAATLTVDIAEAEAALLAAMTDVAGQAGRLVTTEALAQGVHVPAVAVDEATLQPVAASVAQTLADQLKATATVAARQASSPGVPNEDVVDAVETALDAVTEGQTKVEAGGALHGSMNAARIATLGSGPLGAVYAQEANDSHTCIPCHHVDGRWLGNTDDMAQIERSYPAGAYGGYIGCLGGERCRGTVVGVWRQEANDDERPPKADPDEGGAA